MKENPKWLILFSLIFIIAGIVILTGWRIWQRAQDAGGRPVTEEKRGELKKHLDENPRSIFRYDPYTSYRLKSSFRGLRHESGTLPHATNSAGILGAEEINPDPRVDKILFLGDSLTYGTYVPFDQIFVSRMQEMAGSSFQLLNTACPGWSTHQELIAYERYFSGLPLQAVVIVFCLNDLLEFEWVWRNGRSLQMSEELIGLGGLFHSKLTGRALKKARSRFLEKPELLPLAGLNNTCLSAYLPERWEDYFRRNLPLLKEVAKERILIMVSIPARPQLEALNLGGDRAAVTYPQLQLKHFCSENGFKYIETLKAFESGRNDYDTDLFSKEDGTIHLSPKGHRQVARYLWPRILRAVNSKQSR